MKKLFFFRSSSNNGKSNAGSPPSTDKQVYWEVPLDSGLNDQSGDKAENSFHSPRGIFPKSQQQVHCSQSSDTNSGLRRCRSLSSAAFLSDEPGKSDSSCPYDLSRAPSACPTTALQQSDVLSSKHDLISRRQVKTKQFEVAAFQNSHGLERPCSSSSSKSHHDSSRNSSCSNVSSKVLDRYIDGEQQQLERSKAKNSQSQRYVTGNGNAGGRLPPRVHYAAPASLTDNIKHKPRSHSFREAKSSRLHFSSRDWVDDDGFGHESPRQLAKNVIERLSQNNTFPKPSSKEIDRDFLITPEDNFGDMNSVRNQDAIDVELLQRSKEAEERVVLLSEELEHERFLPNNGFDIPLLIQIIRSLTEDKISLAIEVSGLLKSKISDRDSAKDEIRLANKELESRTRRLEKEKYDLQSALEKELDRRSSDWSIKLERYHLEEHRLRERVRELAEQNVALQREVSSGNERETESRNSLMDSEQQLRQLTTRVEDLNKENQDLKQTFSELQGKYAVAEEERDHIKRNFEDRDKECKELQKSITQLLRTCSGQEKTIEGLRQGFNEAFGNKESLDKFDKQVAKLQMEQMRLTGVELALRRELESLRLEVDSLRHENINLLDHLKGNGKDIGALTLKLDKELWTRTCCLQNQGLSMLNECTQLCVKLLECVKGRAGHHQETMQGMELMKTGLHQQFAIESDVKVQGLKKGIENLTRSLQTMSSLLHEKSSFVASESHSLRADADGSERNHHIEDSLRFELKAEILLTSLLREKLYSKDLEIEQLQAELAAAVRGNGILQTEVHNALDNLSCVTQKLKDFDIQMLKKDENVSRLQNDLHESMKELTRIKGVNSKISEERDLMWEEVKQYDEKTMVLDSEVNMLKKKIEALEEDILLKEGQITILKDTLKKPFDIFSSPDCTREFLPE